MSAPVLSAAKLMRDFLFANVYDRRSSRDETEKAEEIVRFLYRHFTGQASRLPAEYLRHGETVERGTVDYIAGMTDHYAMRLADELKG